MAGPAAGVQQNNMMTPATIAPNTADLSSKNGSSSKKKDKNKKLTKADIGAPTEFRCAFVLVGHGGKERHSFTSYGVGVSVA